MPQSLREETEGKLQMLLLPREFFFCQTSLFKEVRVFKERAQGEAVHLAEARSWSTC